MTTSVALSFPAAAHNNSTAATQRKPYFARIVESLSPEKVANAEKQARHWRTALTIAIIAFPVLTAWAALAMIFIAPPAALLVVGVGALLAFTFPASTQFNKWSKLEQDAMDEAKKYKALQHHYAQLEDQTPVQLQHTLLGMGIVWNRIPGMQAPENLTHLKPLLAASKYFENYTSEYMRERDQSLARAQQLTQPEDLERKNALLKSAFSYEDRALHHKLRNAFVNAVLRNPNSNIGDLKDIGTISWVSHEQRSLSNAASDSNANQMLIFNNRNLAPITFNDVKTMNVADLGQRIFAAITV